MQIRSALFLLASALACLGCQHGPYRTATIAERPGAVDAVWVRCGTEEGLRNNVGGVYLADPYRQRLWEWGPANDGRGVLTVIYPVIWNGNTVRFIWAWPLQLKVGDRPRYQTLDLAGLTMSSEGSRGTELNRCVKIQPYPYRIVQVPQN